jgi:superfamily II DNA or RNA helicase
VKVTATETATNLWLQADTYDCLQLLRTHFRVQPPDYWRSPKYQLYKSTNGQYGWDGYLPLIRPGKEKLSGILPRGHKAELVETCLLKEVDLDLKALTKPFAHLQLDDVAPDLVCGFELDHSQRSAIAALVREMVGTAELSVGAGKTAMFFGAINLARQVLRTARFLYVVPTERLVKQVYQESAKLAPGLRVSQFGGGRKDKTGTDVVVATAATLRCNFEELVAEGWFKTFTGLIYDEVHGAAAAGSRKFIEATPAPFRWGASDSVKDSRDSDVVKGTTIRGLFGPALHRATAETLIVTGRLAKPNVYLIDVDAWSNRFDELPRQAPPGSRAWCYLDKEWVKGIYTGPVYERTEDGAIAKDKHGEPLTVLSAHNIAFNEEEPTEVDARWCLLQRQHDEAIIRFRERNILGVQWATHMVKQGWPTLMVATRTLHTVILASMLEAAEVEVKTLTGQDSTKTRDQTFAWLTEGPGRVLVSPLVKEGVSLPELRAGIIMDYVAGPDLARQILGRFIRRKPTGDNVAHVAMFVDRQTPSTRRGSLALIKELERLRGFSYSWPCHGPEDMLTAPRYEAAKLD